MTLNICLNIITLVMNGRACQHERNIKVITLNLSIHCLISVTCVVISGLDNHLDLIVPFLSIVLPGEVLWFFAGHLHTSISLTHVDP